MLASQKPEKGKRSRGQGLKEGREEEGIVKSKVRRSREREERGESGVVKGRERKNEREEGNEKGKVEEEGKKENTLVLEDFFLFLL